MELYRLVEHARPEKVDTFNFSMLVFAIKYLLTFQLQATECTHPSYCSI